MNEYISIRVAELDVSAVLQCVCSSMDLEPVYHILINDVV